jgi:hypothetical protein
MYETESSQIQSNSSIIREVKITSLNFPQFLTMQNLTEK